MAEGLAGAYTLSDVARRNGNLRHGTDDRPAAHGPRDANALYARPRHYDDLCQLENAVGRSPRLELPQIVHPHDKEEFCISLSGVKLFEGINRVRNSASSHLNIRETKTRISSNSMFNQLESLLGRSSPAMALVRRLPCRDEEDRVQIQSVPDLIRYNQMSDMRRIECSTQNAKSHRSTLRR